MSGDDLQLPTDSDENASDDGQDHTDLQTITDERAIMNDPHAEVSYTLDESSPLLGVKPSSMIRAG